MYVLLPRDDNLGKVEKFLLNQRKETLGICAVSNLSMGRSKLHNRLSTNIYLTIFKYDVIDTNLNIR